MILVRVVIKIALGATIIMPLIIKRSALAFSLVRCSSSAVDFTKRTTRMFVVSPSPNNNKQHSHNSNKGEYSIVFNKYTSLEEPTILFSNHHLLVVNKSPGWHSVPNSSNSNEHNSKKCLLEFLKKQRLGGGSNMDFLLPMHRIDQPCTGVILYAKNSKAATRITTAWKKGLVQKEYWCVVEGDLHDMRKRSKPCDEDADDSYTHSICGTLTRLDESRSVIVRPISTNSNIPATNGKNTNSNGGGGSTSRFCQLQWNYLRTIGNNTQIKTTPTTTTTTRLLHLIKVKTATGARHQVRAMLSHLLKSPVVGDLRYGLSKSSAALPDQSVALHARSLFLPTVQLGGSEVLQQEPFISPIPLTWAHYFGLAQEEDGNVHTI